jgi:hypothetical protein
MTQVQSAKTDGTYAIRRYRPDDRAGFLSLYEDVWERAKGSAWFDWRFRDNPYADEVEMVVAEREGTVVGAEPLLPFRLTTDSGSVEARQPVDWIVHPDHRRRGLFTRMTEHLLSTYADRATLLFNFPSDVLRPGLQKFDWTEVGQLATRYRVQHPRRVVPEVKRGGSAVVSTLARAGTPALRACLGAVDRTASPPDEFSVERVDGVATRAIRTVYEETRPGEIHVARDESFLEWRFANPRWETATYVARRGGRPVATAVVATERFAESTVARLLDVQPMTTDPERAPAFAAALVSLLADHADVDVLKASADHFPTVLRRCGFLSDDGVLFSHFSTPTTHAVRPCAADVSDALGRDVFDPDEWVLTLGDRDVE